MLPKISSCFTIPFRTFLSSHHEIKEQLFRRELFEGTLIVADDVAAGLVVASRGGPESGYLLW